MYAVADTYSVVNVRTIYVGFGWIKCLLIEVFAVSKGAGFTKFNNQTYVTFLICHTSKEPPIIMNFTET